MAEDEETATARYIASNVSTQLMLKALFELIGTMMEDPAAYRSDIGQQAHFYKHGHYPFDQPTLVQAHSTTSLCRSRGMTNASSTIVAHFISTPPSSDGVLFCAFVKKSF